MDSAFLAVFFVAIAFTIFTFIVLEEDAAKRAERPIYLILIALVAWPSSLYLLQAPATATTTTTFTGVPLNCVANSANALTANDPDVVSCGTTNQTSSVVMNTNSPFPVWASTIYMAFAMGMTLIMILLLVQYNTIYSISLFLEGLTGKRKR